VLKSTKRLPIKTDGDLLRGLTSRFGVKEMGGDGNLCLVGELGEKQNGSALGSRPEGWMVVGGGE